jgi:hypothetical protein
MDSFSVLKIHSTSKKSFDDLLRKFSKNEKRYGYQLFEQMVDFFQKTGQDPAEEFETPAAEVKKLRNTLVSFIRRQEKEILAPMSSKVDVMASILSRDGAYRAASVERVVGPTDVVVKVEERPRVTDSKKEKESVAATDSEREKDWKAEYEKVVKERDEIRADLYEVLSDIAYTTTDDDRRRWVHQSADIESMRRMRIKMGMPLPPEH